MSLLLHTMQLPMILLFAVRIANPSKLGAKWPWFPSPAASSLSTLLYSYCPHCTPLLVDKATIFPARLKNSVSRETLSINADISILFKTQQHFQ